MEAYSGGAEPRLSCTEREDKANNKGQNTDSKTSIWCLCFLTTFHPVVRLLSSEEPVDLLSLRVQVDVVEARPGGQAGDRGHLGREQSRVFYYTMYTASLYVCTVCMVDVSPQNS